VSQYLGGFLATNFNPLRDQKTATVEYLVVAGGGGGAGGFNSTVIGNGGGGAGGLLTATGYAITTGSTITVTVGSGGAGGSPADNSAGKGVQGNPSVFGAIICTGGGYGAGSGGQGGAGGSGGGNGGNNFWGVDNGGPAILGQGNKGGSNYYGQGSGGGGAGSVGLPPQMNNGSSFGGTGLCSNITGQQIFYAGGGGGGNYTSGVDYGISYGGAGGGGNGSYQAGAPILPTNGTTNTGGGGGGGSSNNSGGSGGSGIVIIRYPQNLAAPASITGNPQILYNSGYQIYVWTSSGSITF
jgi:hypothetical protein